MREVIGAYHKCVADAVTRFDGFTAKYMGDGVLIYFGYPQAHEDDPERAVRAGLALVSAMGELAIQKPLQVRIGIDTGLVVVGDLVGVGESQERSVVGESPNLAARLQGLAEPNTVVIGPSTRRLLGQLFEVSDLGSFTLKGFATPVQAYQVLRASAVASRFEAFHSASALTPIIGRDEEVELLLRRWQRAKSGRGQLVLLSGEPGIGKSRLAATVREDLRGEVKACLRYFCSANHVDSSLHPVVSHLEHAAGFERDDPPETRLDKLAALLASTSTSAEDLALLADLLSIPADDRYPPLDLPPRRKKERTLEALFLRLVLLAGQGPVLMIYEDVHWIDPTSRELLELTIERLPRLAVLLLVTFRPEFRPPWIGHPHVTAMELSRLGRSEGAALVERIAGVGADLPDDIMEEIVERTDGVPLFLEELTKAVLETRATGHDARGTLSRMAPSASAVPTTLQASLLSRLDHLGHEAKEIAQVGAAIGREFSYELLSAVRQDEGVLKRGLDRLVGASLLFQRGGPPNTVYAFKHALVQDTAYMTLLRGPRRELHARIALVLEQRFPEISGTQSEVLAHHFAQAGSVGKAADYWHRAGRLALTRSAVPEAVAQLTKALAALDGMPDGPERQGRELDLQMTLGGALISAKGYAAPETGAAFARARELCQQAGDTATTFRVLYGEWAYLMVKGEVAAGYEVTEQFLHLAEQQGSSDLLVIGHRAVGANALVLGRLDTAEMHLQRALAL